MRPIRPIVANTQAPLIKEAWMTASFGAFACARGRSMAPAVAASAPAATPIAAMSAAACQKKFALSASANASENGVNAQQAMGACTSIG